MIIRYIKSIYNICSRNKEKIGKHKFSSHYYRLSRTKVCWAETQKLTILHFLATSLSRWILGINKKQHSWENCTIGLKKYALTWNSKYRNEMSNKAAFSGFLYFSFDILKRKKMLISFAISAFKAKKTFVSIVFINPKVMHDCICVF